jgi:hypothetical protein
MLGEYALSPHSGSARGLGDTAIGARSQVFGECVVNVETRHGEGTECTRGDLTGNVTDDVIKAAEKLGRGGGT